MSVLIETTLCKTEPR